MEGGNWGGGYCLQLLGGIIGPVCVEQTEDDADDGLQRMSSFLERMQPGRGPTEQLVLELAALGSLINGIQQLMNRTSNLEV